MGSADIFICQKGSAERKRLGNTALRWLAYPRLRTARIEEPQYTNYNLEGIGSCQYEQKNAVIGIISFLEKYILFFYKGFF